MGNKTLKTLSLEKTNLKDTVLEKVKAYLEQDGIKLEILNLNQNQITGAGLRHILIGLLPNKSVKVLSLNKNSIIDDGMDLFKEFFNWN